MTSRAHRLNRGGIGSPMGMPGSPDSFMDPSSPLAVSIFMFIVTFFFWADMSYVMTIIFYTNILYLQSNSS